VYLDISRSFKYLYLGFTEKESTGLCTIERGYRSV
ncbi:putative RNA polymerase sigma factor domain protein, partial [Bacteroides fragilis str. 34-F-2 